MPPFRLFVVRVVCELPQATDGSAVHGDGRGGKLRAGRLLHKGHELVGKAGHGATDADAAHVGTAADAVHPAAFSHIAVDDRSPAAEFDDALFGAVVARLRKVGLFIVAGPVAAFMNRMPEQPQGRKRSSSGIIGACPAACRKRYNSVSIKLSGSTGQPGTQTIGMPASDFQPQPK